MLAPDIIKHDSELENAPAPQALLPAELHFYKDYTWCLNPHLTVRDAIDRLGNEIIRLPIVPRGWQTGEIVTNVFLLSSGLLNCVDEYLRGPSLRLPPRLAGIRFARGVRWVVENILGNLWSRPSVHVRRWREDWLAGLNDFLSGIVAGQTSDPTAFTEAGQKLAMLLDSPLPSNLLAKRVGVPAPFRRLDLTHVDILALGRCYVKRFPDRSQAILLVGLRTSGSYFAPLLQAYLGVEGYRTVSLLTLVPNKGAGRWERKELKRYAEQGYTALIVDDPPDSAAAVFTAFEIARQVGFGRGKLRALVPTHIARRDWFNALPDDVVVSLEPEQWHKRALLEMEAVQSQLAEYFKNRNFVRTRVVASDHVVELNARLQDVSSDERATRLKRIFEVHLETIQGHKETRYVLAKSVGWGWLGYHAFLAGHRLAGFVPPILGLRDGILYSEWIPQPARDHNGDGHGSELIDASASYVAARTCRLNLDESAAGMDLERQDNGIRLLRKALSKAYGTFVTDMLVQQNLERLLHQQPCPFPTLIDGNMQSAEWIVGSDGLLKTDYEHHGMCKAAVNVVDPAYDLADTILKLRLSHDEEKNLIRRYVDESGDAGVEQRLFMNKLLAGLWAMKEAQEQLFSRARTSEGQQTFHRRFMSAWDFLTVQAARHCGNYCPSPVGWRAPLVMLDIDGVIDRRLFGFPCTTAAGIEALALLHAHDFSVAVNTARSAAEVKDYCKAYSLVGGVAEHGSYLWDGLNQRGRVMISSETMRQLDELKKNLRRIPGVFLDDRHQYSIRAFTYRDKPNGLLDKLVKSIRSLSFGDGVLAPLPTLLVKHLMTDLGLDRLSFHQTTIDTTIVAKEVDKGSGLLALRNWVLGADAETIAVGDGEPDLAMFRVATRSFAPANIGCLLQARLLGCLIVDHSYQRGLLEIARALTQSDGPQIRRSAEGETAPAPGHDLFMDILRAADRKWIANLIGAVFPRGIFRRFTR